jgi:DNA-directed RNA polymerase specialized sigma24 family protein
VRIRGVGGRVRDLLFRRYAPEVQRYVRRRLGADAADDVVAETFLAAFRQRHRYDFGRMNARPWLYGIATHRIGRHTGQRIGSTALWPGPGMIR